MAQVKLLKVSSGLPTEMDSAADDITLNSFTAGAGPVMSPTGIDMNNKDITDANLLSFTDPAADGITQTAGLLVADNIMGKDRNNVMSTAGAVLFPVVTDVAGELDSFKLPNVAGVPSATPSFSAVGGYLVYDSTNKNLYVWDGAQWDNLENSEAVENVFTAGEDIDAGEVVYISAANTVSLADADSDAASAVIGIASATVLSAASVPVIMHGIAPATGLTAGARYYLSTTAGALTNTAPTGAGNNVVQVGIAKSATALALQIEFRVKRAA